MKRAESEKRGVYEDECRQLGHRFIPFVATTDGCMGDTAVEFLDEIASAIAKKWKIGKGRAVAWVRGRMSLAIVRASSSCIRGSRKKANGTGHWHWPVGERIASQKGEQVPRGTGYRAPGGPSGTGHRAPGGDPSIQGGYMAGGSVGLGVREHVEPRHEARGPAAT